LNDRQETRVALSAGWDARYNDFAPFHPARPHAEYPLGNLTPAAANPAYEALRKALALCGLDRNHLGSPAWNPLGKIASPGDTVVLKPNFVRDFRESCRDPANCVMTHGSVIRAVIDYVYIALAGRGRIVVADAPHSDADFERIREFAGLDAIQELYRREAGFEIEVYDLRPEIAHKIGGVIAGHRKLPGDPAGYVKVDLADHSAFAEIQPLCDRLYGSEYDMSELYRHHSDGVHEYLFSRTVLDADVVISIPKLKTHKKVGLTVNLKNLVGINGNKNWLPHHREGTPAQGGDQFPNDSTTNRVERSVVTTFKKCFPRLGPLRLLLAGPAAAIGKRIFGDTNKGRIRSGNWHGNDTTWRMVLDLNRALLYADTDGRLHDQPVRRFFSIVDGIIAGEGNGPLDPTPKSCGLIVAGFNSLAVDTACARLMGFDMSRIPLLREAFQHHPLPLMRHGADAIECFINSSEDAGSLASLDGTCSPFVPHFGWTGRIEARLSSSSQPASTDEHDGDVARVQSSESVVCRK